MQTKHLFLLPALTLFACVGLQAQVTIGGLTPPAAGALLDLNSTAKGGLVLSNVTLLDLTTIPSDAGAFTGVSSSDMADVKAQFKGAVVFHTGENGILAGIYIWTGTQWIPSGTNILYDAQGNDYTIGHFGVAGTWTTQNLRTTVDSAGIPLKEGYSTTYDDATKCYNYPGQSGSSLEDRKNALEANNNKLLEAYGLLYNWRAASGRTDDIVDAPSKPGYGANPSGPGDYCQGICPKGWHLPSDWEWSQLEKEIATHPELYSSSTEGAYSGNIDNFLYVLNYRPNKAGDSAMGTGETDSTYWGRQMKSTTTVPDSTGVVAFLSSSKSREAGGFDALCVGYASYSLNSTNLPTYYNYGTDARFWSSSTTTNSNLLCMYRRLDNRFTNVLRTSTAKTGLYSVRCKKD